MNKLKKKLCCSYQEPKRSNNFVKHHSKCRLILSVAYFSKQWGTFTRRSSSANLHPPLAVKRLINHSIYVVWRLKPFLYYFTVFIYPRAFLKNIFYFLPIIFFCKTTVCKMCIRLTLVKLSWLSPVILSPTGQFSEESMVELTRPSHQQYDSTHESISRVNNKQPYNMSPDRRHTLGTLLQELLCNKLSNQQREIKSSQITILYSHLRVH